MRRSFPGLSFTLEALRSGGAVWADFDGDGDPDLFLPVYSRGQPSRLYRNDGGWKFTEVAAEAGLTTDPLPYAPADIDGDGALDLYLTQWPINEAGGAPHHLYRNEGSSGNWLEVDLQGTESNRSAIGALVTVTAELRGERRRQLRLVTSRTSWRSANSLTQHVGLGDAESVDRIEVSWPSGRHDSIAGPIEVNRRLPIVEEQGLVSRAAIGHGEDRLDER